MADRASTPPPQPSAPAPLTPEQIRQLETSRLKAKALRARSDAALAATATAPTTTPSGFSLGQKRPYSAISTRATESSRRDGSNGATNSAAAAAATRAGKDDAMIRPAKKFEKSAYIEYDFSKMTDTKGGFMTAEDDPHNRALHATGAGSNDGGAAPKPAHMTQREWERHQLLQKLRAQKTGPFEPGISVLRSGDGSTPKCVECASPEIDWAWADVFSMRVCHACKESLPEKYSLLTKTEAREDYLLTDSELRDASLLPRLERPNPHKASFHSMQLFLRCQVEEYAFSARKWGSAEALDEEFERRQVQRKERKEKKFNAKLAELKKRTRVEAHRRNRDALKRGDATEAHFGQAIASRGDRHEHEWGRAVEDPATGAVKKSCVECGMEVEELEF
ncbi:uncharacterized protein K452DRAFT_326049 [Aplosporella prunicola CBS 121167]|uniref:DNA repair protein RAD14 n=1 Tax=Aplosporella prunicola CBS 121167 TaxID=1176127 RepID=A0A6A6BF30_9PEZI|nr:uncharacterized protein K452DRAFT_326049 [Aplosporella prunicola CBS 121167]KAF2142770.1 hypothetical protein K452DRAFT_326049 [Aplosporella prunicola CBS 121167]